MNEAKQHRADQDWQKLTYAVDRVLPIMANPVNLMIGGFVLTNVLEHTPLGDKRVTPGTAGLNLMSKWFSWDWIKDIGQPVDVTPVQLTVLTADQANVLRAGLVMVAASQTGIFSQLGGLVKAVV